MYIHDNRIVITLDAGGTNLVFGAMRGCEYITEPITYPSNAHDLDLSLDTMVKGFHEVIDSLDEKPVAINHREVWRFFSQKASEYPRYRTFPTGKQVENRC